MQSRRIALLALVFLAIALSIVSMNGQTSAQPSLTVPSPSWKYKVVDARQAFKDIDVTTDPSNQYTKEELETFLTEQGKGGWELVAYSGSMAVYKREASK